MDYTFLTVEQFQELEKAGALLESGLFEGLSMFGTLLYVSDLFSQLNSKYI